LLDWLIDLIETWTRLSTGMEVVITRTTLTQTRLSLNHEHLNSAAMETKHLSQTVRTNLQAWGPTELRRLQLPVWPNRYWVRIPSMWVF